jgi:hypothetical protein
MLAKELTAVCICLPDRFWRTAHLRIQQPWPWPLSG